MMLLYQLFRPFSYIRIRHPVKKLVDWYLPLLFTGLALIVILPFRPAINLWGADGFFSIVQGFIQGLPGFYIAALAAVATFGQKTSLDTLLPAPTPTLETNYSGTWVAMRLTRRRFLCLLFAYLTAVSILLSIASPYIRMVARPLRERLPTVVSDALSFLATSGCLLFVSQLIIITLWGLYYLSDRMHHPEPYVSTLESSDSASAADIEGEDKL